MTDPHLEDDHEPPLDPALLRMQDRLKRLMLWSRGIMVVSFAVLFGVLFYKVYGGGQTVISPTSSSVSSSALSALPDGKPIEASLAMPAGGRVTDARLESGRLVVTVDAPSGASVLVIELETMKLLRRFTLTRAAAD